jgi:hypothetical protein
MNTATQTGADPDVQDGEVVVNENPRLAAIDAMTARMENARTSELQEALEADPGLAQNQAQINDQIDAANAEAIANGTLQPPPSEDLDGAASRTPIESTPEPQALPGNLAEDPLAEYIVMQDGQPMFQTKVNGQDRMIPLAEAKKQLQIGTAAAARMSAAANYEQQTTRELQERERIIADKERALTARMNVPAVPAQADLSENDLLEEAQEIFNTAFTGSEDEAAKKLAKTLMKIKNTAPAVQTAPIDERAIVSRAAKAAVDAIQKVSKDTDIREGYAQFQSDYPEIMSDPMLYKMADSMTDQIEKENPSWPISHVMQEAGKRTREWVTDLRGDEVQPPSTSNTTTPPDLTDSTQENRNTRKANMVRIPTAAVGAVYETPSDSAVEEQTPQQAFAELQAARGQYS